VSAFRFDVSTNDSDEAMEFMRKLNTGIDMDPRVIDFSFAARAAGDERFFCVDKRWTAAGNLQSEPQSTIVIVELAEGAWDSRAGRTQVDTTRPSLFPAVQVSSKWDGLFAVHSTQISIAALNTVAAEHFGMPGLRVNFSGSSPVSLAREQSWKTITALVREQTLGSDEMLENDLVRANAFDLLTAGVLVTFANNTLDVPAAHDGGSAVPASIRRAISYMEEHISEPIRLEDIAAACRLSPRGLQDAFLRILGLSPMNYLRRMRLESARFDLLHADPASGDTVAVVARRWGFGHLPRFSAAYRAEYGEYPSDTLRR
jgi:AraC-like DNA-binding protein